MKHYRLSITLLFCIVLTAPVNLLAQKKGEKSLPADCEWFFTSKLFKTGNFEVGQIAYSAKKQGVGFLNEAGKPAGDVPVEGGILALGITKGGIVVIYTKNYNIPRDYSETIKEVHAMLIDPKDRKIIADRMVWEQQSGRDLDVKGVNNPDGSFSFLGIAVGSKNGETDDAVNCIYLAEDLTPTVIALHTACLGSNLMQMASDGKGNFYVASCTVDQVTLEKFTNDGTLVEKLAATADMRKNYSFRSAMHVDMTAGKPVLLSVIYTSKTTKEPRKSFYSFDFNAHKVAQAADVDMDKAYKKQLLKDHSDLKSATVYRLESFQPLDIFESGDKIITLGEFDFNYFTGDKGQGYPYCEGGAAFVCVYDKSLKLQKEYVLNRWTDVPKFMKGISAHLKDDKMYLISYELTGIETWGLFCYTVDFAKGSVDKKKLEVNGVHGTLVAANSIFWSGDNCLIDHVIDGSMLSTKKSTVFLWMKPEEYK